METSAIVNNTNKLLWGNNPLSDPWKVDLISRSESPLLLSFITFSLSFLLSLLAFVFHSTSFVVVVHFDTSHSNIKTIGATLSLIHFMYQVSLFSHATAGIHCEGMLILIFQSSVKLRLLSPALGLDRIHVTAIADTSTTGHCLPIAAITI